MRSLPLLIAMAAVALGEDSDASSHPNGHRELIDKEATACGRDSSFVAYALVEHEMDDPNALDSDEIDLLKSGFKYTYNALNKPDNKKTRGACDAAYLRYTLEPTIEAKDIFYEDMTEGGLSARRNFLYSMVVHGTGVSSDITMFEFGNRDEDMMFEFRRDLQIFVPQEVVNKAGCASCNTKLEARAPTEEEFTDAFNDFIKSQKQMNKLTNIGSAIHVTELEIVKCNPKTIEIDTEVVVDVAASQQLDFRKLESDFKDSYNDLASFFCDPCFHVVESVRTKVDREGSRMLANKKKKRLLNKVKARCRKKSKCRRKKKIFDDTSARRLSPLVQSEVTVNRYRRRLVDETTCFCPTQPAGDRPPNTDEFTEVYGTVTKITNGVNVMEVSE